MLVGTAPTYHTNSSFDRVWSKKREEKSFFVRRSTTRYTGINKINNIL